MLKNLKPRVSVGIPVYNGERFIERAIGSILGQTFTDLELVISDNASTDRTEGICRAYAMRDPRVRYSRQEANVGMVANLNRVAELACGDYFMWLCCDDYRSPDFVARCVEVLDNDPNVSMCFSQLTFVDDENRVISRPGDPWFPDAEHLHLRAPDSTSPHERLRSLLLYSDRHPEETGMFRLSQICNRVVNLPYPGGNKVFLAEMALKGRGHEIHEPISFKCLHKDSASKSQCYWRKVYFNSDRPAVVPEVVQALFGHISVVMRANLGMRERMRCVGVLAQYVLQVRKWRNAARRAIRDLPIKSPFTR